MTIRDRIQDFRRVPARELLDNEGNPRTHPQAQRDALRGLLEQVGVAGAVTAYRSERNGGKLTLIDGHLRKQDYDLDWPTLILDVDDAEADLLLASHDPLAALAEYDRAELDGLLQNVRARSPALLTMLKGLAAKTANRPSHEGAAAEVDRALAVCFRGGFRRVLLRGDTDFSQTQHLDRWDADGRVRFVFGYDAAPNLVARAREIPEKYWRPLQRPSRHDVRTRPRERPDNVKEAVVVRREFENIRLQSEQVAEFNYRPTACRTTYRMVVVRKNLSVAKGVRVLFDDIRYFFYISNDWVSEADEIVFCANDRCRQENLLAQLHGGVRALRAPVGDLVSNWAYMVMTALAWDLKAWWVLLLPEPPGRWQEKHHAEKRWVLGLEFKTFVAAFVRIPCQIVRTGRRLVYRLLAWNPHLPMFFRLVDWLRC